MYTADNSKIVESYGRNIHRHADDWKDCLSIPVSDAAAAVDRFSNCVAVVSKRLSFSRLRLNPAKTLVIWLIIIIILIIIPMTMFIVLSSWPGHCECSLGSLDECRTAPSGRGPSDQATWLVLWVRLYRQLSSTTTIAIYMYYYYSARKLILINRPTEGRRLSWPRHCRKGAHSSCPRL